MSVVLEPNLNSPILPKSQPGVCDFADLNASRLGELKAEPFPHMVHREFIAPELYEELRSSFPDCPPSTGPTGFSLYWGDQGYSRLMDEQPAWGELFNTFHSQRFIEWVKVQFGSVWQAAGCKIDLEQARYVPYREDRIDKERATLRKIEHEPHELWVRMDIHQGQMGYDRGVHVDHARRLVSMLIYMCDQSENEIAGGELFLHTGQSDSDRHTRITPRHNLMVGFPCTSRSYHSVSEITSMAVPRNYVQVHISSSVDIWPREAMGGNWQRRFKSLRRRLIGSGGVLARSSVRK